MRLELDKFNSEVFGLKMANIIFEDQAITQNDVIQLVDKAKKDGFNHLSAKIDIMEKERLNAFLPCGFNLVDTQIMYEIPLKSTGCHVITGISRPYDILDKNRIIEIAKYAYKIDRFHSDPSLQNDRCDYYYQKWKENLCEGLADKVFVIDINDYPVGFTTLKYDNKTARAVLAAVDSKYQGNGYYSALMEDVVNFLLQKGFEYLYLGTQLANLASLRTVGRLNGVPKFSNHVLHKML